MVAEPSPNAETNDIWPMVYGQLRRLAEQLMRHQPADHTLQPTALVHEVFARIAGKDLSYAKNEAELCTVAAQCMRRILVDHSRRRGAVKRGKDFNQIPLSGIADIQQIDADYLLALEDALCKLKSDYPELCQIVELRFFGGFGVEDIARLLGLSETTLRRRWRFARGWLHRHINHHE